MTLGLGFQPWLDPSALGQVRASDLMAQSAAPTMVEAVAVPAVTGLLPHPGEAQEVLASTSLRSLVLGTVWDRTTH